MGTEQNWISLMAAILVFFQLMMRGIFGGPKAPKQPLHYEVVHPPSKRGPTMADAQSPEEYAKSHGIDLRK